jgi:predicted nucleic acid-binding protein
VPTLIDTNILVRSVQPSHDMHAIAVAALEILLKKEEPLVITIQNVAEFWNVATRPERNNGLGFTIEEAQTSFARLEGFFQILSEDAASYADWKAMLTDRRISGAQVHDARLVAVMKVHGIARIVTFNVSDFTRFPEIEAIHPETVKQSAH